MRFNGHEITSSSIYIRLDPPGVFYSAFSVFCEINFYISSDWVSSSLAERMFDMSCDTLALNSVGHQESWPTSHDRQPQTLTLVNCFLLIGSQCKASKGICNAF